MKRESFTYAQILSYLGHLTGERMDTRKHFNDVDQKSLFEAVEILMHISLNLALKHRLGKFSREQKAVIVREFGKNIRQSVELFTGVDLRDSTQPEWPETIDEEKGQ